MEVRLPTDFWFQKDLFDQILSINNVLRHFNVSQYPPTIAGEYQNTLILRGIFTCRVLNHCVRPLVLCFQVVSKVISGMKWVSNQCFTHIQNICRANQFSGFYIIETLVYSELKNEFCIPLKTKYSQMVDYQQQSIRK